MTKKKNISHHRGEKKFRERKKKRKHTHTKLIFSESLNATSFVYDETHLENGNVTGKKRYY